MPVETALRRASRTPYLAPPLLPYSALPCPDSADSALPVQQSIFFSNRLCLSGGACLLSGLSLTLAAVPDH